MKKFFRIQLIAILIATLLSSTAAYAKNDNRVSAKNSVIRVLSETSNGFSTGSAFAVGRYGRNPEYFITNAHVVLDNNGYVSDSIYLLLEDDAVRIKKGIFGFIKEVQIDESKTVRCDVVNKDSITLYPDVAIIHSEVPIKYRQPIALRSSRLLNDGESVYALGFPGVLDNLNISSENEQTLSADVNEVNLTSGIVSMKKTSASFNDTDIILHSAAISPGNSGGPLIDENGAAVGINTYSLNNTTNQFVSIYIDYAIELLNRYGISYETARSGNGEYIVVAAAVAVLLAAVLISVKLLRSAKKKGSKEYEIHGLSGEHSGHKIALKTQLSFGRAPDNDVLFPDSIRTVSRHQCVVIKDGSEVYIKDTNSSNGTYINGRKIKDIDTLVPLKVGDVVFLGTKTESFRLSYKD